MLVASAIVVAKARMLSLFMAVSPFSLGAFDDAAKSERRKSEVTANTRKVSSIGKTEGEKFVEKSRSSRLLRAETFAMSSFRSNAISRAFPAEVETGSALETRQNKSLESFRVSMKHGKTLEL